MTNELNQITHLSDIALKDYQTLIVGSLTFTIGLITVLNAIMQNYLLNRNRAADESRKKLAFCAVIERDLDSVINSLTYSSQILNSIHLDRLGGWANSVRLASRISMLRSFDSEWDKLYVVGNELLRPLRSLALVLFEIDEKFKFLLSEQDAARSQSLPLFDKTLPVDDQDVLAISLDSIGDAIDSALELARNIKAQISGLFGEKPDALGASTQQQEAPSDVESDATGSKDGSNRPP